MRFIFIFLAVSGLLLVLFPQLDLAVSNLVYNDDYFALSHSALAEWLKDKTSLVMLIAGLSILGYLAFALWQGDFAHRRKALYLLVAIALGPGLVTNVVFKDHWGRARPREVIEFGGKRQFTPALIISNQCPKNCSFYSGHAAIGFFWASLAFVLRRRYLFIVGFILGWLFGLLRLFQGAHFLSDIVFAGLFTMGIAYLLAQVFGLGFSCKTTQFSRNGFLRLSLKQLKNLAFTRRINNQYQASKRFLAKTRAE
jgi:lipid A 4'-phosphatase